MYNKISFKEFMKQVEERIEKYSLETLQKILLEWAKNTPSADRYEFLARFVPPLPQQQALPPDDELLEEIRELAKQVKDGDYCDGWGWDDEIHEERDWGDEGWVDEVDEFFSRAHDALINGHYKLAENAYVQLFKILEMGEEPGHLPGSPDQTEMLGTDLEEARACYLRAVYLSTPLDERSTRLLETMQKFSYSIGDNLNLQSIINAQRETLPDFTKFLTQWADLLKTANNDMTRYLLREAVMLSGGTSAIEKLARQQGESNPKAYVEWVNALEKEGDFQAMITAAREGLADIPKDYVVRAEIANGLVRAGEHLRDMEAQLFGWREAFYSHPSLANLLSLLSIAEQKECRREEIETAITRIISLLKKEKGFESYLSWENRDTQKVTVSENLLNQAYLLAGRYEDAFDLCRNKGALGWSYGENPKGLVIPFFLMLLSNGRKQYPAQNLGWVWDQAVNIVCGYAREELEKRYIEAMDKVFKSIHLSEDEEKKYLRWSIEEVGHRVDAIVGEKHRQSYHKAANLLVALAEVLVNHAMKADGAALIENYQRKYHRHIAFQHELREAMEKSGAFT